MPNGVRSARAIKSRSGFPLARARDERGAPTNPARLGPIPPRPGPCECERCGRSASRTARDPTTSPARARLRENPSPCASTWSASISSWPASILRAECARYQANSTPGVAAAARSQSMRTRRSPSKPRLSPRRSPWMRVVPPPYASTSACANGRGSRASAEHDVGDVRRTRARRTRPSLARTASGGGQAGPARPRRSRATTCRPAPRGSPPEAGPPRETSRCRSAAAARMRRLSSRDSRTSPGSSSEPTSRIATHAASPSRSTATIPWPMESGIRSNAPAS